ncbi:alpha/beta hydrolase [Oharaeibacter diazotrophicus]|uniref:Esterase/lipase superfamily enzyme n=1 Tax=Oharaeibacter diazotrophicus TaxID=1920512 RepID=A0A4R6RE31_9HYPH|nr:alpha/beta hydrolase [Oharaeibacter diazotrophicus]TDP84335.1 esterase/lipase superfamily enzyme [Oharaeibacter diazotrophicus]BBE73372.1 hypothetical protein OHA_1_02983 [Pleomorphomonas sp. SM30]GLS75164.1 hypothetical protein GCM10007904_04990 [Oharaeibacter diazotrophicus]
MRPAVVTILLALTLATAGCAGRPDGAVLVPVTTAAPGATDQRILVATTRERETDKPGMFSGERAEALDFADLTVSVPPTHKDGVVEWPRRLPGNPATDFVTRSTAYVDGEAAFAARLKAAVASRPNGSRDVAVFVHGYNTRFDEAVFRAAQLDHDTAFDGVTVLFTWASRGGVLDYVYDRDSATVARDGLERTLTMAARSGADHVFLFAHSMGNWLAIETLRQARIGGHGDFGGKLSQVFLASPDIDVDVFKAQMRRLGVPKPPFILFASSDDQALAVSSLIAGDKPRLGAYTGDAEEIADLGVVVVDLSKVAGVDDDALNHSKFAAVTPAFTERLRRRIAAGDLADPASGLAADATSFGGSVGGFVGRTAGAVITLPAYLVTAPFRAVAGR